MFDKHYDTDKMTSFVKLFVGMVRGTEDRDAILLLEEARLGSRVTKGDPILVTTSSLTDLETQINDYAKSHGGLTVVSVSVVPLGGSVVMGAIATFSR